MRAFLTAAFLLMGGAIATEQSFGPVEGSNNAKAKLASAPGDYDAVDDVAKGEKVTIDICFKGDAWCAAKWSDNDGFIDGSKVEVSVHGAQKTLAAAYRAHSKKLAAQDAKRKPAPIPQATASTAEIFAWGDSLTAGAGVPDKSASYPSLVAGQLRMPVRNLGIGGQTSTQIAARQGGLKTLFGVEGNAIPASGSVRIIERNIKPITGQKTQGFTGKLACVPGRLTRARKALTRSRGTLPGQRRPAIRASSFSILPSRRKGSRYSFGLAEMGPILAARSPTILRRWLQLPVPRITSSEAS